MDENKCILSYFLKPELSQGFWTCHGPFDWAAADRIAAALAERSDVVSVQKISLDHARKLATATPEATDKSHPLHTKHLACLDLIRHLSVE